MSEKTDTTTRCLLIVVVVVVALLSIVAIIIAAVSLGGNKTPTVNYNLPPAGGATGDGGKQNIIVNVNKEGAAGDEEKTWMIAIGHDWGAQEYIDVDGYIRGFQMDLITEVCEAAGMVCRTVWEPYKNCYDSEPGQHSFGGKGLLGGWYDACCGWVQTVGRSEIFDFSQPFLQDETNFFYVKKGGSFDLKTAKKIGFLDGWSSDEKCLARSKLEGSDLKPDQVVHFNTTVQLIAAINDGKVNAGFGPTPIIEGTDLEKRGDGVACSVSGSSMMTRKDNEFNAAWNKGWQAVKNNGVYRKLCEDAKTKHAVGRKLMPCYT